MKTTEIKKSDRQYENYHINFMCVAIGIAQIESFT
jgi:hypothetical protein